MLEDDRETEVVQTQAPDKHYRLPSDELITDEVKQKMEIVQTLLEPCAQQIHRQKKEEAARKLGVSIRSVERLMKKYRE